MHLGRTAQAVRQALTQRVARLEMEYGKELVEEALSLFNTSDIALIKNINMLDKLEEVAAALQKINSNEQWKLSKYDPIKGLTMNSIDEALAGIGCEEQGILNSLKRSTHECADFIQGLKEWDVKTPYSQSLDGKNVFDAEKFTNAIRDILRFNPSENLIVDTLYLTNLELSNLHLNIRTLNEIELTRILLIDSKNAARTIGKLS